MKRPLFWPLAGFIAGILSVPSLPISRGAYLLFSFVIFLWLLLSFIRHLKTGVLIGLALAFFLLGHFLADLRLNSIENSSRWLDRVGDDAVFVIGRVDGPCEENEAGGASLTLTALAFKRQGAVEGESAQGKVLLRIKEGECLFETGDVIRTLTKLKSPRRFQNRSSFDYPFFLKTRGILTTAFAENTLSVVKIGEERGFFERKLLRAKEKIRAPLERLPDPERRILAALLLGEKKNLPEATQELFQRTGTTHLLVVSGLHLVMIGAAFYFLFRFLLSLKPSWLNVIPVFRWAAALSLIPMALYAALVGFSPSVLRAVFMAGLASALILFPRERDGLSLLGLVAFALLLFEPLFVFDLSFQLSFLSIFFILLGVPRLEAFLAARWQGTVPSRFLHPFLQALAASLVVQIGLLPLLATRFHQVSLVSLPANLILVPLFTFLLMPLGLLGMLLAPLSFSLSAGVFWAAAKILNPVQTTLRFLAELPGSAISWPGFGWVQTFLYYALFAVFLLPLTRRKKIVGALALLILNAAAWTFRPLANRFDDSITLNFLDVGQGDALFLKLPGGKKMLVDGGGFAGSSFDVGERVLKPFLFSKRVSRLDAVVLTHPHPDHYGGLRAVVKTFRPREIWWNGESDSNPAFLELMQEIRRQKIPLRKLDSGQAPFWMGGLRFEVLSPEPDVFVADRPDSATVNNHSLVLHLSRGNFSALLAGDIEQEAEKKLLEKGTLKPVWLLKVPHHGSDTSSTEEWVRALNPRLALIGVGRENPFRFPRPAVLSRYENLKTRIYRTDQDGEIEIRFDDSGLRVEGFTGREHFQLPVPDSPSPGTASPKAPYGENSSGS